MVSWSLIVGSYRHDQYTYMYDPTCTGKIYLWNRSMDPSREILCIYVEIHQMRRLVFGNYQRCPVPFIPFTSDRLLRLWSYIFREALNSLIEGEHFRSLKLIYNLTSFPNIYQGFIIGSLQLCSNIQISLSCRNHLVEFPLFFLFN